MTASISLIERRQLNGGSYGPELKKKGYKVFVSSDLDEVICNVDKIHFDVLVIDAASKRTSGRRLAQKAIRHLRQPVILVAPEGNELGMCRNGFATLVQPITYKKLLNKIAIMASMNSKTGKDIIAGMLRLVPESKSVIANGKITQLTPKVFDLLLYLLKRQGEVVSREELMQNVWHTNYFGDMRTIDVHINWLRAALDQPGLIRTFSGVGYRFDTVDSQ